jgi:hypothetical protein
MGTPLQDSDNPGVMLQKTVSKTARSRVSSPALAGFLKTSSIVIETVGKTEM